MMSYQEKVSISSLSQTCQIMDWKTQEMDETVKLLVTKLVELKIVSSNDDFLEDTHSPGLLSSLSRTYSEANLLVNEHSYPGTVFPYIECLFQKLQLSTPTETSQMSTIYLLSLFLKKMEKPKISHRFSMYAECLLKITFRPDHSMTLFYPKYLMCCSAVLCSLPMDQWTNPFALQLLNQICEGCLHSSSKVQKCSIESITAIMKYPTSVADGSQNTNGITASHVVHPGSNYVVDFFRPVLEEPTLEKEKLLEICEMLEEITYFFDSNTVQKLFMTACSLLDHESLKFTRAVWKILAALVESPSVLKLEEIFLKDAITILAGTESMIVQEHIRFRHFCSSWVQTVTTLVVLLIKTNYNRHFPALIQWFTEICSFLNSKEQTICTQAAESLSILVENSLPPTELSATDKQNLMSIVSAVEMCLFSYKEDSLKHILTVLGRCFSVVGPHLPDQLFKCLTKVSELSTQIGDKIVYEAALCSAIKSMKCSVVLPCLPLTITGNIKEDQNIVWILSLLQLNISVGSVVDFQKFLLPIATRCLHLSKTSEDFGCKEGYQMIERSVWKLLRVFCKRAVDIDEVFSDPTFSDLIMDHIRNRSDIRRDVMSALTTVLMTCRDNGCGDSVVARGGEYMDLLFSIYMMRCNVDPTAARGVEAVAKEEKEVALNTVDILLSMCGNLLPADFFDKFLSIYYEAKADACVHRQKNLIYAWKVLAPYADVKGVCEIYKEIAHELVFSDKPNLQKKAYQVLEGLVPRLEQLGFCVSLQEFIDMMETARPAALPCAMAPRLRCLRQLMVALPGGLSIDKCKQFVHATICEALTFYKPSATRLSKVAACSTLLCFVPTCMRLCETSKAETVEHFMDILLNNLVTCSQTQVCALKAIEALSHLYKDVLTSATFFKLFEQVVKILNKSRKITTICLEFFYLGFHVFDKDLLVGHVSTLIMALNLIDDATSRRLKYSICFVLRMLCRRFGWQFIEELLPPNSTIAELFRFVALNLSKRRLKIFARHPDSRKRKHVFRKDNPETNLLLSLEGISNLAISEEIKTPAPIDITMFKRLSLVSKKKKQSKRPKPNNVSVKNETIILRDGETERKSKKLRVLAKDSVDCETLNAPDGKREKKRRLRLQKFLQRRKMCELAAGAKPQAHPQHQPITEEKMDLEASRLLESPKTTPSIPPAPAATVQPRASGPLQQLPSSAAHVQRLITPADFPCRFNLPSQPPYYPPPFRHPSQMFARHPEHYRFPYPMPQRFRLPYDHNYRQPWQRGSARFNHQRRW